MLILNNPGNIRISNDKFNGELQPSVDPNFKQFVDMAHGYRAMFITLNNYAKHGYNTIAKIINRYAPSNENDTAAYIDYVSKMGLHKNPNDILNLNDKDTMIKLVETMSAVENGVPANKSEVEKGYNLAFAGRFVNQKSNSKIELPIILVAIFLLLKNAKKWN